MQFHPAIFSQFSGVPEKEFVWFGTWIVQKKYLNAKGFLQRLQYIPGLRKRMGIALWNSARFYPSTHYNLPFPYDALQISEDGNRARGFIVDQWKTIKTVFRNSRYGENTERELAVRTGILQSSSLKIPKIYNHHFNDDYVQFVEEFIPGRIFSHWRDSRNFWREIGAPLLAVCEQQGIGEKPLADILEEKFVKIISDAKSRNPQIDKAKALLEKNPVVATSFSHGDTVSSNMIVNSSGIYLVDWERSAERYAGYDFARLALKHPGNADYTRAAKDVFDRHQQGRFTLEQADIIRLGVAAARKAA